MKIIKEVHIVITDEDLKASKERFESKFEVVDSGCWEWRGSRNKSGRGNFSLKGLRLYASHVAWMLYKLEGVPSGKFVLHTCDNPPCVNPEHLYLGTQSDNMQDVWDRNRRPRQRGSKSPSAKLSETQVRELREERSRRGTSTPKLAKKYGISKSQAWNIVSESQWRS